MGEASLADGFKLIGFETWSDPTTEVMEDVLQELLESGWKAFVILGKQWSEADSQILRKVRSEGGRIVITMVPQLHDTACFHCDINDRIQPLYSDAEEAME